jgi:hypothetical protein
MCGIAFVIAPPDPGPMAGGFLQGPGGWPAAGQGGMPFPSMGGMPPNMPMGAAPMSMGGPMPMSPAPAGPFNMPAPQPFGFNQAVNPVPAQGNASAPVQPSSPSAAPEEGKPRFDLGFDPNAKESLPFELPGQADSESQSVASGPFAAPPLPAPSFQGSPSGPGAFSAMPFVLPGAPGGESNPADFLSSAPEEAAQPADEPKPPKVLHIRCPSGHLVKAGSELLGKAGRCPACKKTFELRYEDSVEFRRRKDKIMRREETKLGKAWLAWAFLVAFLAFAAMVSLLFFLNR